MDLYLRYILAKQDNKQIYVLRTHGLGGELSESHKVWLNKASKHPIVLVPIVHHGHYSLLALKRSQPHIVYFADSLKPNLHGEYRVPADLKSYLIKRNHGNPIQWMNLHSPLQVCNNCGIHVLQNCEMVYYHGDVENVDLDTLLGEHGAGENVNHLRMCIQDLMCRVQANWIKLGNIPPFLRNTRKPVPRPGHKPVLLQAVLQWQLDDWDTLVIGSNVYKDVYETNDPHINAASRPWKDTKANIVVDVVDGYQSEFQRMEAPGMATDTYVLLILGRTWMDMEPGYIMFHTPMKCIPDGTRNHAVPLSCLWPRINTRVAGGKHVHIYSMKNMPPILIKEHATYFCS